MYSCVQLCPALSICVQLCTTASSCLRLCPTVYSCVRLCPAVSGLVNLCTAVSSCVQLSVSGLVAMRSQPPSVPIAYRRWRSVYCIKRLQLCADLRNASLGDFVVVRTSYSVLTQTQTVQYSLLHTYAIRYSLLLLGYKLYSVLLYWIL
jgi:hypothetical protein